eukprot:TRINITY_DN68156_c5_g1_i20.p1 TRINITY_DN68156_c5_g1~~TRINITY_DN68156_c5_g1_i20.p1  ORF type:complete len:312 (-),score=22.12 TRINITY_DN68156_c5_g1_i20:138-1073(-)
MLSHDQAVLCLQMLALACFIAWYTKSSQRPVIMAARPTLQPQEPSIVRQAPENQPVVGLMEDPLGTAATFQQTPPARRTSLLHHWLDSTLVDYCGYTVEETQVHNKKIEGHTGQNYLATKCLRALSNGYPVSWVVDIGFGAGHSTATWLSNGNLTQTRVLCFDLCENPYAPTMDGLLAATNPLKHTLVCGDTQVSIPTWIAHNSHLFQKFSLIHIDGGHRHGVPQRDLENVIVLAKQGAFVVFSECHMGDVHMAWNAFVSTPQHVSAKVRQYSPDQDKVITTTWQGTVQLIEKKQMCSTHRTCVGVVDWLS